MARLGVSTDYALGNGGISGKIFYGTQLGGDDAPVVDVTTMDGQIPPMSLEGLAIGRDSVNLGCGAWLYLDSDKSITLSGDYNAIKYKHALTQNMTATLGWQF